MTAGSGSASTSASASRVPQAAVRSQRVAQSNNFNDVEMISPSQQSQSVAGISASQSSSGQQAAIIYPRSVVSSLRPTAGAYTPHMDSIKKCLQLIADSTVDYEESHGDKNHKGAGLKDSPAQTSTKKLASRSKLMQASLAERDAFSTDPQIHDMEAALHSALELQQQVAAERQALEGLTSILSLGGKLPAQDLRRSFEHLLSNEVKHLQTRRKQALKTSPIPGVVDVELWELRKKVWEVHHGHDPLPTSGALAGSAAGGGYDEDDEDMEIVVTADTSVQSLKCPLTTNFLKDPVTSSLCKHSFSKDAIISLIQGRRGQCMCPVHGCNRVVTMDLLQPNKALARKVARQIAIQEEISQAETGEYTTVE
ncbi:zinc-finger of the MIZ type in Nse subunit-domain-containing protein [Lobosporangium transversale]|uniref:Zinc-finger of the MIZ type in Nse subunit-domain-containing protein n=1 Tax=Lobosporangium transversale TaxID=64571 RepID=A0A1Y2GTR4_9FUNG|nr:zinc-finger of the MIZ type in Nse subunit-domain-containing protein [Lobosporangium transversale]ORZ22876.1 zinc-finger of the MIZ type in Nse subunit-domain-containing protein [Lobosporangium transversale]|eukprot:XP_021883430.1 zinc-finger of the MIZ type in Nse subunit-domain-containing protein [Lobosporangium transversale]